MENNMAIREVKVENGRLLGSPSGIPSVTVFRGIPYAAPPIGALRWAPPQPAANWDNLRLAHSWPPMAMQPINATPETLNHEELEYAEPMSEDCLYLNVWTPAKNADERLPVLLWIHGGAFFAGHSYGTNVDGDYFARKGVILVSIAYRLGVFGFLGHPDLSRESPNGVCGNYGILDQLFALRWVHKNIAAFGGDPEKITIAGQSAGSSSVQALVSSPLSRGLGLHGAAMFSGVGMRQAEFIQPDQMKTLEAFGVSLFREMEISGIEEARSMDAQRFLDGSLAASNRLVGRFGLPFKPVVDGYVLPKLPSTLAQDGKIADIYYMVGHTDEILLDAPVTTMESYEAWLKAEFGADEDRMRELFGIRNEVDLLNLRPNSIRGRLITASHAFCHRNSELGRKPSYYYYFSHRLPGDNLGAFHGGELWYFFKQLHRCWRPFDCFDHRLAGICADYLMNFVKNGDPNSDGLPHWSPDTADQPTVMILENPVHQKIGVENAGIKRWINMSLAE